jgi:hypothetical protein
MSLAIAMAWLAAATTVAHAITIARTWWLAPLRAYAGRTTGACPWPSRSPAWASMYSSHVQLEQARLDHGGEE